MDARSAQYDRQLRLWGATGQDALEKGHACLCVGGCPGRGAGSEALKSLVLAGIGAITVVDPEPVSERDLGADFFLEARGVGESRARELVRLLLELNGEVRGNAVPESVDLLLADRPDFFADFSVVIACGLADRTAAELSRRLWEADVPLLLCRSVGFLSGLRVQVREFRALDTHPDNLPPDLRLHSPFPALADYVASFDLDAMEAKERAHVPWPVILYKALRAWSRAHDSRWPLSHRDKEQVRDIVRSSAARDEENFREAVRAVNGSVGQSSLPSAVKDVLYDEACINLTQKSAPFWIVCSAIRSFVEEEGAGALPLRGVIPDMTAATQHYVELATVYRRKAAADAEAVYRRVLRLVAELGVEPVPEADVKSACRHACCLRVVRGSRLADEYVAGPGPTAQYVARHLEEPDPMMLHYVLLRAAERFHSEQCRAPGEWDPEADIPKLKACAAKLLGEWACPPLAEDDYVHELCRYGGSELPSVSAFVGGCAAHEAIKLVTRQYVPVDNFFIHESMTCKSATFTF